MESDDDLCDGLTTLLQGLVEQGLITYNLFNIYLTFGYHPRHSNTHPLLVLGGASAIDNRQLGCIKKAATATMA